MTRFTVDLDELDSVVASMEAFGTRFAGRLDELRTATAALQEDWLGDAADAQALAHRRIATGAQEMHAAVVDLHQAARHAHQSYLGAVQANQTMWKQVR
jgi:WXG100 family type VII secretion target